MGLDCPQTSGRPEGWGWDPNPVYPRRYNISKVNSIEGQLNWRSTQLNVIAKPFVYLDVVFRNSMLCAGLRIMHKQPGFEPIGCVGCRWDYTYTTEQTNAPGSWYRFRAYVPLCIWSIFGLMHLQMLGGSYCHDIYAFLNNSRTARDIRTTIFPWYGLILWCYLISRFSRTQWCNDGHN